MAAAAKSQTPEPEAVQSDEATKALAALGPLASVVGKSATALWTIFVRRYVAIGVSQLFGGVWVVAVSIWLMGTVTLWLLVPFTIAGGLMYLAIQNLINPHYPALGDVVMRVKELNKPAAAELVQGGSITFRQ